LLNEPVTPLLLKVDDCVRENFLGDVNRLAERISHDVRLKCTVVDVHFFEEIACFLVHAGCNQLTGDLF
jgi:hypothetical protein